MSKLEFLKKKADAEGVKKVVDVKKLPVRSMDLDNPVKDEVLMLAEKTVYERKIGTNKAQFVYVNRVDDKGNVKPDSTTVLYLGQFTRVVSEYDPETLTKTGTLVKASGTVVNAIQECATWDDVLTNLDGKPFKVTDVKRVNTLDFNDPTKTRQQSVYSFDFV